MLCWVVDLWVVVVWSLLPCLRVFYFYFLMWAVFWVGLLVVLILYSPGMLDVIALCIWVLFKGGPYL